MEPSISWAGYRGAEPEVAVQANRRWWSSATSWYLEEHGDFLGDADLLWCPEGVRESQAQLLGDLRDQRVLEVGCGAGQGSRFVRGWTKHIVGVDLSDGMLEAASAISDRTAIEVPLVQADARRIPFADASFDIAFSAYGALPFVAEIGDIHREVHRVLRPGGRWVFSVTHPIRSAFPDVPGPLGLTSDRSYFDRTPYVELDESGAICYTEFHHTLADQIAAVTASGLVIDGLVEPEWPSELTREWGGWSPLRGRYLPGTTIWRTHRPAL